jgi:predicted transcriptional regulator
MKYEPFDQSVLVGLGANVREARQRSAICQHGLSEKAGIFHTYLTRIESGQANPKLKVLVALAKALDASQGDLLG